LVDVLTNKIFAIVIVIQRVTSQQCFNTVLSITKLHKHEKFIREGTRI
jgi:hypothetical protein